MEINNDILRALKVNKMVYEGVRAYIKPGVTERDIYELTRSIIDEELKDVDHEFIGDFVGGPRCGEIGGDPTDYVLAEGDGFILDLSVRCGSMWSDTCRTFFLGRPSEEVTKAYNSVLKLLSFGSSFVRPDMSARTIKEEGEKMLAGLGYGGMMPHHMGHAIGPKPFMAPQFVLESEDKLTEGTYFTLEPGVYSGQWGLRVENNFIMQADGPQLIFDYPVDLDYFVR